MRKNKQQHVYDYKISIEMFYGDIEPGSLIGPPDSGICTSKGLSIKPGLSDTETHASRLNRKYRRFWKPDHLKDPKFPSRLRLH